MTEQVVEIHASRGVDAPVVEITFIWLMEEQGLMNEHCDPPISNRDQIALQPFVLLPFFGKPASTNHRVQSDETPPL
jgi:hypothetical protein